MTHSGTSRLARVRSFLAGGVALLALAAPRAAQWGEEPLDPKTYTSPSGEYALCVDPSARSGAGEARYRFTQKGAELWAGKRPWTLWEADVGDDGLVGGYAYAAGYVGGKDDALTIVLVDASGKTRLEQRSKREGMLSDIGSPSLMVQGLFLDRANDRLVVRVRNEGDDPETWWTYALSDGSAGPRLQPSEHQSKEENLDSIEEARPIPGLPLTLLRWSWMDFREREFGAVLTLVDRECVPQWRLDWKRDHSLSDEDAQDKLRDELRTKGVILATGAPGRFTLRHVSSNERVTFEARHVEGARSGWDVREVERAPYSAESTAGAKNAAPPVEIPVLALRALGTITLGAEAPAPAPIHDVMTFALDGSGHAGAICRSDQRFAFVLCEGSGAVLGSVELPEPPKGEWWVFATAWVGGQRWIVTASSSGEKASTSGFWLDFPAGKLTPIDGLACPEVKALAGSGDGGFVVLATLNFKYGMAEELLAFDANAKQRWTLGGGQGDPRDPASLFFPQEAAVTSDGRVVVVDSIRKTLQFFSGQGKFLRAVELDKALGKEAQYPSGVRADRDGGVIVHDSSAQPPIVRMDKDDRVVARFQPRFADGKTFYPRGKVQVDRDGGLWTSDGQSLLALDRDGVVQRVIGAVPDAATLGRIGVLALGPGDRIYAADERTAAVHVFDASGKPLHVCKPDPQDFEGELSLPFLNVDDAGEVSLDGVRFAADGARIGKSRPGRGTYPQHGSRRSWVLGYKGVQLVESDGSVVCTIERAPSGAWLRGLGRMAVAPDGALAFTASAEGAEPGRPGVYVYSASAQPLRALVGPRGVPGWNDFAFDGQRFAFGTSDEEGKPGAVFLMDLEGRLQRVTTPRDVKLWQPFFAAGAKELWLFDGERRIERFALP